RPLPRRQVIETRFHSKVDAESNPAGSTFLLKHGYIRSSASLRYLYSCSPLVTRHYPSTITFASAWLSVCVIVTAICFTPNFTAIFFASPCNSSVGLPPLSRTVSTSTHRTPRLHPVPSAFIAASFTAKRPAYRSYLFLNCSQYARSFSV